MITTSPLWPNLTSIPTIMSADVRTVPLELAPEGWKIDVQRLIDMVDVRTCAILINSPNNPTGWHLGWIAHPVDIGTTLDKLMEFSVSCAPDFSQAARVAATEQGEDFIAQQVGRYRSCRDLVVDRLGGLPRVSMPHPNAAFYAFFHIDGVDDTVAFAKQAVGDLGVGLAPGEAFGEDSAGWLRVCFAVEPDLLNEALDRLEPALR